MTCAVCILCAFVIQDDLSPSLHYPTFVGKLFFFLSRDSVCSMPCDCEMHFLQFLVSPLRDVFSLVPGDRLIAPRFLCEK